MDKYIVILIALFTSQLTFSQSHTITGRIISKKDHSPIEFATVSLSDNELWAITNHKGEFTIRNVPVGKTTLSASSLGYVKSTINIDVNKDMGNVILSLPESNLALDEVVVTAQQKASHTAATGYMLDRSTLDHAQILNVADITSLLPGGKSAVNSNIAQNDDRLALRSETSGELGNASFGTAIEVDGVRLQNNSVFDETKGFDTRNLSSTNIESIEVISGIPSVEHGDLTSGLVKINTRKGKTPATVEFAVRPHTKQIGVSKGFNLGARAGVLNVDVEHTKSISDLASPYTSFDRNALSLKYSTTLNNSRHNPLTLEAGFSGNIGGFDSKADPDAAKNDYIKKKENVFRGNFKLKWLLNCSWITNLELTGSMSYADKLSKMNTNKSSASSQAAIHAVEEGYFMGSQYDESPTAPIILLPTGYWDQLSYYDNKPVDYTLKLKADWVRNFGVTTNKVLLGADFSSSGNEGKGSYYDDMRYAPTWREYRLDEVPYMNNLALYMEDKITVPVGEVSRFTLTAGVRSDITMIKHSEYGTVHSFSPRFNARYVFWENATDKSIKNLSIYAGWGKAVKLPSFSILYPSPAYSDELAFTPATTSDGTTFYAYHSIPSQAIYNPNLKWQYSKQNEIGLETNVNGTRVAVSAFRNKTYDPYIVSNIYTPYSFRFTDQRALENCLIPSSDRQYTIDQNTGIVTVSDKTSTHPSQQLYYTTRETYTTNKTYINGSAVERRGIDWSVDFAQIPDLHTKIRLDGNFYYYKGLNENITAWKPSSSTTMYDGGLYRYVGYYAGSSTSMGSANKTSASQIAPGGGSSSASVSNGTLSRQTNANMTVSTHIPKVRLIVSLKIEGSFYNYKRNLSEYQGENKGFVLDDVGGYFGENTDIYGGNRYVALYPLYYTTWDDPNTQIPFKEKFLWAKDHDAALYADLAKLVVKSNTAYFFNPQRISSYFSANISVTKEIGDIASISFYANNFLNSMRKIKNTWNDTESSLYNSGYIPKFYYGLSLRIKL